MIDTLINLKDGGVWIMPVITLLMAGTVAAVVLGVVVALKVRIPSMIWLLIPTAVVLISTFGMSWGLREAWKATQTAPPEMAEVLGYGGASIALLVPMAGALALIYLGIVAAWAAGVSGLVASFGAPARTDILGLLLGLVGPVVLAVLVGGVAIALGVADSVAPSMAIFTLLASAIGLGLAAARVPTPEVLDADEEGDSRASKKANRVLGAVLSARATAWLGLATAAAGTTWYTYLAGTSQAYSAVATAPPEMRAMLEYGGRELASLGTAVAAVGLVGSVLLGLGMMAVVGKRAFDGSRVILGSLAAVPAIVLLSCAAYASYGAANLVNGVNVEKVDLTAIVDQVGDPPVLASVGPFVIPGPQGGSWPWTNAATLEGRVWTLHKAKRIYPDGAGPPDDGTFDGYEFENALVILPGTAKARALIASDLSDTGGGFSVRISPSKAHDGPHLAVSLRTVTATRGNDAQPLAVLVSDNELYLDQGDDWMSAPVAAEHGDLVVAVGPDVSMNGLLTLCSFTEACHVMIAPLDLVASELGRPLPVPASDDATPNP